MRKSIMFLLISALLSTSTFALTATTASASMTLTTCTDLDTQKTIAIKVNQKNCKPYQAPAIWKVQEVDSSAKAGAASAPLRVCTSKNPNFTYQQLKKSCPKFQVTTDYRRAISVPTIPKIVSASARGHDGATLTISAESGASESPIAYYLVTNLKTSEVKKVQSNYQGELPISGLSALTSYTFQIVAVNIDGISPSSTISQLITTSSTPVIRNVNTTPTLAAPAFTISSIAETKTVNSAITGYSITSSGGTIASFSISPSAPTGTNFNTSDGSFTGSPTSVAGATVYTVTATNASGSTARTFTLTVTAIVYTVGQTGPGGGKIFYYNTGGFSCGVALTLICNYLEVNTSDNVRRLNWSSPALQNTSTPGSTGTSIGTGQKNTAVVVEAGASDSTTSAIAFTDQYISSNGTSDWFLASKDEMTELSAANAANLLSGFTLNPSDHYTSSQVTGTANQVWIDLTPGSIAWYKNYDAFIIPIRAG